MYNIALIHKDCVDIFSILAFLLEVGQGHKNKPMTNSSYVEP